MEPQTAPQPAAQPQPSLTENFSPSTVALTKALGQAESGGKYNATDATGDNADSEGAYQMTPGFLQEWAPKAGVQYTAGTKLTPQQQDEIAGNAVQTMTTTGDPAYPELGKLTPAQVASAWNTGNPDAYLDQSYGQNNTYGSTEAYVNKVGQLYNQEASNNPQAASQNTQVAGNTANGQTADISQNSGGQPGWESLLEGLGIGGLGWLAGAAKAPLEDAATGAVTGAVAGSILPGPGTLAGAGTGALGGLTEGVIQDITGGGSGGGQTPTTATSSAPQEPTPEPQSSPLGQPSVDSSVVQNAINESMQGTQSNRAFSQSSNGQQAIQTAAQFGLIQPDENGILTFNDDKAGQVDAELGSALDNQIKAQPGFVSPASAANYAGISLGNDKTQTATDRKSASNYVQKFLSDDTGDAGMNGQVSLTSLREAQKAHYAAAKNGYRGGRTTPEIMAHKALGEAYGRVIRDNLPDKDLYDRTKKMQRNLINAREVGKRLQGKRAPVHVHPLWQAVARRAALAAETYIGDAIGGPVGGIIGAVTGDYLNGKLDKHFSQSIFETKSMKAALATLRDSRPEAYTKMVTALKQRGISVPKDSDIPSSDIGKAKQVAQDEKKFNKGLVKRNVQKINRQPMDVPPNTDQPIDREKLPPASSAVSNNVDYMTIHNRTPHSEALNPIIMKKTFEDMSKYYKDTNDAGNAALLTKLKAKYEKKGLSPTEVQALNDEYGKAAQYNRDHAVLSQNNQSPPARLASAGLVDRFRAMGQQQAQSAQNQKTIDVNKLVASLPTDDRFQAIEAMVQKGEKREDATRKVTTAGLMDFVKKNGMQPIKVRQRGDGSYEILDGLNRLAIAKALGMKDIPVEYVE